MLRPLKSETVREPAAAVCFWTHKKPINTIIIRIFVKAVSNVVIVLNSHVIVVLYLFA
jgi:hypothetical protein